MSNNSLIAKIILTDKEGVDYIGEVELTALSKNASIKQRVPNLPKTRITNPSPLDFDLNIHAFLKRIGINKMSGPVKLTALIAFLAKGDLKTPIKMADVRRQWNKLTSTLGKFNTFYSTPAKANAWIDPIDRGTCRLRQEGLDKLKQAR